MTTNEINYLERLLSTAPIGTYPEIENRLKDLLEHTLKGRMEAMITDKPQLYRYEFKIEFTPSKRIDNPLTSKPYDLTVTTYAPDRQTALEEAIKASGHKNLVLIAVTKELL